MMKTYVLILMTMLACTASADVLTFDDVTTNQVIFVPQGYGGFSWDWFGIVHQSAYPGSGYENAVVSGEYAAFNISAEVAAVGGEVFDFNGVYLTAAWREGLNILVEGWRDGALVYESTVVVDAYEPTWCSFNYIGIDTVVFESFGGVDIMPGTFFVGPHFAMDDFTFNEPTLIPVAVDIQPDKLNVKSKGKLSVVIAGSAELDVNAIDTLSLEMLGVRPRKSCYQDVTMVTAGTDACNMAIEGPDGYMDLVLQFDRVPLVKAIGQVNDGDIILLTLTGWLQDETPLEGSDCIEIIKRGKCRR
jgi:hypothetical protein